MNPAQQMFLAGCGLPQAWAGQRQWRILDTGFDQGLNFLAAWAAWRGDAQRPRQLHFIACAAEPASAQDVLDAAAQHAQWQPLAQQLAAQCWGLLPGVHRLFFEGGQVLLTLYVGPVHSMLRQQKPLADTVYLTDSRADAWSLEMLKAVARCCRLGARLATECVAASVQQDLRQCGFAVEEAPEPLPHLQARFAPRWQPRPSLPVLADVALAQWPAQPYCMVIGAGLAGAAVACSLARRGWRVSVLDAASAPAGGASGLPAGLFAPHVSSDDNVQSRLSRAGVRTVLQHLHALAADGKGLWWDDAGVLEHRLSGLRQPPWDSAVGQQWSRPASAAALAANGLPDTAAALWHGRAGWVRPGQWVRRLLAQPGIDWHGDCAVAQLRRSAGGAPGWQALDAQGAVLMQADMAVLCASLHSAPLAGADWPLQALRGQVSWGLRAAAPGPWPQGPVNGHGNLVPDVPLPQGRAWVLGSTFERDCTQLPPAPGSITAGHAANQAKLADLLPPLAQALEPVFAGPDGLDGLGRLDYWAGVRCAAPDRLPLVGPVDASGQPGLWVSTAMGARGLSMALLCAELLAARLHGEPLPLDAALARALGTERL